MTFFFQKLINTNLITKKIYFHLFKHRSEIIFKIRVDNENKLILMFFFQCKIFLDREKEEAIKNML